MTYLNLPDLYNLDSVDFSFFRNGTRIRFEDGKHGFCMGSDSIKMDEGPDENMPLI